MRQPLPRAFLPAVLLTVAIAVGGCGSGGEAAEEVGFAEPTGSADDDGTTTPNSDAEPGAETPPTGETSRDEPATPWPTATARTGTTAPNTAPPGHAGDGAAALERIPGECPDNVVQVGDRLTTGFEHVEHPPSEDFAILTCDWRDTGSSIASIEVSFSARLYGTDLADLEGAQPVTVGGVDGYVLHSEAHKATANMFQFYAGDLYITGGSIEVENVGQGDVLELAAAAIAAVTG